MKVAIYGSRRQDDHIGEILQLIEAALKRHDSIVMHAKIDSYLKEVGGERYMAISNGIEVVGQDDDFDADVVLSIGGDGTFLRTAQWVADREIPIAGVNTGHLGFLAPFSLDEASQLLADGLKSAKIVERSLLQVELPYGELGTWPFALNEVALLKRDSASMITIEARIDRSPLADYLCDGLIIATPTGSTGYNLSVGGPIVQPGSPSMVISPIAAHSLTMRPLVVDEGSILEMKVISRSNSCRVSLDGRSVTVPSGTSVFVTRAPFAIRTIEAPGHNFFATIREKLLWGATARKS